MLRPVIMIGCGGAGNMVVRYTRDAVDRRLKSAGWNNGIPPSWQFIGIDSSRFQAVGEVPFLPNLDYLDISVQADSYQHLDAALQAKFGLHGARPAVFRELMGWRPNPSRVAVPIQFAPGQIRPIGRALGLVHQERLRDRIQYAFNACVAGGPELVEISRRFGEDVPLGQLVPPPIVMVIGSMAGGTGAGIMLDVIELIRKTDANGAFPTLIALSADVFGPVQNDSMNANSAAFVSELLSAYWDDQIPEDGLIPQVVFAHRRGPHSVYLIGRRNLDGFDLSDSRNVFKAVANALSAITTSVQMQQNFVNYGTATWVNRSAGNAGGYGFSPESFPGVASSFGSVTISIGRHRFREYLQKLLLRSVVEKLSSGFNKAASEAFGEENANAMSNDEKIRELAHRNTQQFIEDCGLRFEQLKEIFFSNEMMRSQLDEVSHLILSTLPASSHQRPEFWRQMIISAATEHRTLTWETKLVEVEEKIKRWSADSYQRILTVVNEYVARLSFPVAISMIESARSEVIKIAAELSEDAKNSHRWSLDTHSAANHVLSGRSRLSSDSEQVRGAVIEISKSFVFDWKAVSEGVLARNLESIAMQMFSALGASLRQANYHLSELDNWRTADWPKNDGEVPVSLVPSPTEFILDDYSQWPQQAKELILKSLNFNKALSLDPLETAGNQILQGGFGELTNGSAVLPFIWDEASETELTWEPGKHVRVSVDDSLEGLSRRIDAWLTRPRTEVNRVLTEGLANYLRPIDSAAGETIEDHQNRLRLFADKLQLALMMSRPLIEMDEAMNATVHPHPISCSLSIEGFPFEVGHPARQLTEQVIQGFLGTTGLVDLAFSSSDRASVTITSFLQYPVNLTAVGSLTQPLAKMINGIVDQSQHSHLWRWRRTRSLRQFVPMPQELTLSAIRGFAIARALGVMSAEIEDQNVIAIHSGEVKFPKFLLTLTNKNNLLPALLESMVLAFGDIPTKGSAAFDAYRALVAYGTIDSSSGEFQVSGLLEHFLETGDHDGVRVVDQDRADLVAGTDSFQRAEKVIEYLRRNIERFESLNHSGPDPRSWRDFIGTVEPVDTLTYELLPELWRGYGQVLDAVNRWLDPHKPLV